MMALRGDILGRRWTADFCSEWDKSFRCKGKLCICCPLWAAHRCVAEWPGLEFKAGIERFLGESVRDGREILDSYLLVTVGAGIDEIQDALHGENYDKRIC